MDLIHDFAVPLLVTVIAEMLGIPPGDRARFRKWSDDLAGSLDANRPEILVWARQSRHELRACLEPIVEARRQEPGDDLISALVQAGEAGDRLTWGEVFSPIILLLVAGNETTTNPIGNGMLALLRNPDQLERFRREPELTENAIEELLRYDSPVQATSRIALRDFDYAGKHIREGQSLVVLLGAANRDPEAFPEPDRLDIGRPDIRHFSFGQRIHYCLGSPLACLEGQVALRKLVDTFDRLELAGEPEWSENFILHGLRRLPLRVGRTAKVSVASPTA